MIENGKNEIWKMTVHTIFKNICQNLNKNYTYIIIYIYDLLKMQGNNENKIQDMAYLWV